MKCNERKLSYCLPFICCYALSLMQDIIAELNMLCAMIVPWDIMFCIPKI